jgi:hypothetical protein
MHRIGFLRILCQHLPVKPLRLGKPPGLMLLDALKKNWIHAASLVI